MKRRYLPVIVLLLFVTLVGVSSVAIHASTIKQQSQASDNPEADHEALKSVPHSSSGSCGVERWSVKTGTDADVGLINLQSITPTTIASLTALPMPSNLPPSNRIQPTETTVFQLHDTLTEYKLESDSDYHLILDDGAGKTMIVEIPDPACVAASSPLLPSIQKARATFDARYNVTGSFQVANVPVTITGIGFFDFLHGQTGVAPNGIELHAVLDVQFNDSGTPTPTPTATQVATPTPTSTSIPTPAPTATQIPTPAPTLAPTPTSTVPPFTGNQVQNGGYETSGSWAYSGQNLPVRTTTRAHSGSYSLRVGTTSNQQGDSIANQKVTIPSSKSRATLSFYYWPTSNDSNYYAWQEADITDSSGQVIQQLFNKTSNDRTWILVTFDLSQYAGQTIGIQFLDHENSNGYSYYTYMYVDDVTLTLQ